MALEKSAYIRVIRVVRVAIDSTTGHSTTEKFAL